MIQQLISRGLASVLGCLSTGCASIVTGTHRQLESMKLTLFSKGSRFRFLQALLSLPLLALLCLILSGAPNVSAQETALWCQNFEGPDLPDDWDADRGVWEIGVPANGPGRTHEGTGCAAVGLDANYPANADSRLIRLTPFVVPGKSQNPRLRFWHWFSISSAGGNSSHCYQRGDFGVVQVKTSGGSWTTVSPEYYDYSDWTRASVDLSAYAGQTIQIAFYFYSNCAEQAAGWFIDEVCLVTSPYSLTQEGFENGLGDWTADRGNWTVGTPINGPARAYSGSNCAAIVLDGSYPANVSSMLISPRLPVPVASANPRLRFWHWFSIDSAGGNSSHCYQSGDYGQVYARTNNGAWVAISTTYNDYSDWSHASLDLSGFAEQTVQIGFYFYANCAGSSSGWFIDDIELVTGAFKSKNPESFESGLGDWAPDRGNWTVGAPTNGPQSAHTGTNCAAIVINGSYPNNVSSSLISPYMMVPSSETAPRLRFWHWFSIDSAGGNSSHCYQRGDFGQVYVRTNGGDWTALSPEYYNSSDWTRASLDLTAYGCQAIQVAFYFYANCAGSSSGWFIDDVEIFPRGECTNSGPLIISLPQALTVCSGSNATFCVNASGLPPVTYQWRFNGVDISGATNDCYTVTNVQPGNAGSYTVQVRNPYGSVTSATNSLLVTPICVSIEIYAGLNVSHAVLGQEYSIGYVTDLLQGTNNWITLTNITATASEFRWYDPTPARQQRRFYRVIPH